MNHFLHRYRKRIIQDEMLLRLQEGIAIIERILPNAKEDLKADHVLVEAGKAKRIDGASFRHMSSHPQYLHAEESCCPIRPEKIFSLFSIDAKDTYENRFLMTLVRRLFSFVEQRYVFALKHPSEESLTFYLQENKNGEIYYRTRIESEDEDMVTLSCLREKAIALLHSPFVEAMAPFGEVYSPIHPTNLLLKNPDYHACLTFFSYLDDEKKLGISHRYYEEELALDEKTLTTLDGFMKTLAGLPLSPISEKSTVKEENHEAMFSLEEVCLHQGEVLYSFFPDVTPIDPQKIPLEEAVKARKRLEQLIARQKKAKPQISERVLDAKDQAVLSQIAKRKEKHP